MESILMDKTTPMRLALCCLFAGALPVDAEETERPGTDKSKYNLFNPTPRAFMRELSADRPDKTDSAFTVDAGHFQLEMDFANFTYDRYNLEHRNARFMAWEAAPLNLKIGLLNDLDFQLVLIPGRWERTEDKTTGNVETKAGFGGVTPRLKLNVVGNDGGPFALAVMPFVKLPAGQDHLTSGSVEGGLKIPYAFEVPGWDLSLQAEIDIVRNRVESGYHSELINSVSLGHSIIGKLSGYVEFYSSVSTERNSEWVGTVDTWLTYQINVNWRLDTGIYIGVTRAAEDWHPFVGMTRRF